jgi:hypothetical protein
VGKLHRLWAWADTHTEDGTASGLDADWVDELVGVKGFAVAMQSAGWLEVDADKVRFANFERHNGRPAKTRALGKTRAERFRNAASVTPSLPEEEKNKRREEEEDIPAAPVPTSDPPKASRSPAKAAVSWSADAGWQGITPQDRTEWAEAYPGAVIDQELAKATAWLKANPTKAGRRNWRAFLVRWLGRCQDQGGTNREPGNRAAEPPRVPQERRRYFRRESQESMTDDELAAWKRRLTATAGGTQ